MTNPPFRIYWNEMSPAEMERSGVEFYKCYKCSHYPLIWSTAIGDAICEGCGKWQNGREVKQAKKKTEV